MRRPICVVTCANSASSSTLYLRVWHNNERKRKDKEANTHVPLKHAWRRLGLGIKSGTRNSNQTRTEKPDPLSDPKRKNTRTGFVGWYKKYPNPNG